MEEGVKKLSFPSDIVASYHVRLLLHGALDIFVPSTGTRTKSFSLILDDPEGVLERACAKLEEMGWEIEGAEAEGRDIVVARRQGAVLGLVASEAENGCVLTVLISSEDGRIVRENERLVRSALLEALPGAGEVALKSRREVGGRG